MLYGSGVEKTLPYLLGTDFVNVAEDDGIIQKIDDKNELAIIEYKNGSTDVIDLSAIQSNNSNGGLSYIRLTLNLFNCWNTLKLN
jgi:hypothetical protein